MYDIEKLKEAAVKREIEGCRRPIISPCSGRPWEEMITTVPEEDGGTKGVFWYNGDDMSTRVVLFDYCTGEIYNG
jgi:hypothetical protein